MALPGDVTTFTLTFGPYTDGQGTPALAGTTAKLFPVDPSTNRRLRVDHAASGQRIVPVDVTVTILDDGTAAVAGLPHTGQAPLTPVGWAWRVEWNLTSNNPAHPGNLTFVVPSGAVIDFDLLVPADTVPPVSLTSPTVFSVAGFTGTVTDTQLATGLDAAGNRLSDAALRADFVAYAPSPTGVADTDTANLVALDAKVAVTGGEIRLQTGVYVLNQSLPQSPGVHWWGVEPTLRQETVSTGPWLADGNFDFETGTVLQGDGTFPAFAANTAGQGSPPVDLGNYEIPNWSCVGVGFDNFTHGIHSGAQNVMGLSHGLLDRLYFRRCTAWAVRLVNFAHMTIGDMRACRSQGGFYFGSDLPATTFQPGNSRFGEMYVYTPPGDRKARGIVFEAKGTDGGAVNHCDAQRLQVNRYSVPLLSVSAGFTSGSTSVTVPDGTQFEVGMHIQFTATGNGVFKDRIYLVRSIAGNNLTISGSAAQALVNASATGSLTLQTYGFANIEITAGDSASRVTTSNFLNLDVEGSTTCGVFVDRGQQLWIGIPVAPTSSLMDIALRDAPSNSIEAKANLSTDFDAGSTTSMFTGARKSTVQYPLRGHWQDTARGVYAFSVGPGFSGTQGGDLEVRANGMVYPNMPVGEHIFPRNGALTLTGNQSGDVIFAGTTATTMQLPTIIDDTDPASSHIGMWCDFVNVGTAVLTVSTDGTQVFNKAAGKTSLTIPAGSALKVIAVKDAAGVLFWVAKPVVTLA